VTNDSQNPVSQLSSSSSLHLSLWLIILLALIGFGLVGCLIVMCILWHRRRQRWKAEEAVLVGVTLSVQQQRERERDLELTRWRKNQGITHTDAIHSERRLQKQMLDLEAVQDRTYSPLPPDGPEQAFVPVVPNRQLHCRPVPSSTPTGVRLPSQSMEVEMPSSYAGTRSTAVSAVGSRVTMASMARSQAVRSPPMPEESSWLISQSSMTGLAAPSGSNASTRDFRTLSAPSRTPAVPELPSPTRRALLQNTMKSSNGATSRNVNYPLINEQEYNNTLNSVVLSVSSPLAAGSPSDEIEQKKSSMVLNST
jgi:hypothetical protein